MIKLARQLIRILDRATDVVLYVILFSALLLGAFSLWEARQTYGAADTGAYTAYRPEGEDMGRFRELRAINPEVIGWIRIGALNKSYPVAQAKDNDFYLHRTFEKKDNFAGCIFLNCENSKYFTDQNSIIYGHNMKDGSMFGTLKNFGDQETYDKNPYFWVFTPKLIYQYQIFSCSIVSRVGDPYRTRFLSSEFEAFLETCVENSQIDAHGLKLSKDDRIVTLSTCTGDESTRFIAQGVLKQVYLSVG